jgi:hypothetical protein
VVQTAVPTSDITTDSWTTAPLFSKVNDTSDATLITSPAATTQCEVALGSLTDPVSSTGHTVFVRAKATGSGAAEKLTFYLYEGATLRATSAAESVSRSAVTGYSYALTGTQADSLSAYTDLRVRLARTTGGAGETVSVYDVWLEVPDAIVPVTGSGGVTFAAPGSAASAKETFTGTGGVTITAPAASATAKETFTGTGGLTLQAPAVAGTGTVTSSGVTGTGAVAFAAPAVAGTGKEAFAGTGAVAFAAPAVAVSAKETFTGTGALAILAPTLDGTGLVLVPVTGTAAITIAAPAVSATGSGGVIAEAHDGGGPARGGRGPSYTPWIVPTPRRKSVEDDELDKIIALLL